MVEASFFAMGAAQSARPGVDAPRRFDPALMDFVYFVGSMFFTKAAYLQLCNALNNDLEHAATRAGQPARLP